jgi:disulfide bond formation protein DsbB
MSAAMHQRPASATADPAYKAGAIALMLAVGAILAALAFQYIGGYAPCPLCLMQRYAYYAGVPLLFAALVLVASDRAGWAALVLFIVALAFLANAGLGIYHAGAEWKFWPGPDTCASVSQELGGSGGLLQQLETTRVIRCDEAPWTFLGLSFAGWNVVTSFLIFVASMQAAFAALATNTQRRMSET